MESRRLKAESGRLGMVGQEVGFCLKRVVSRLFGSEKLGQGNGDTPPFGDWLCSWRNVPELWGRAY